jgi:plastocyanin
MNIHFFLRLLIILTLVTNAGAADLHIKVQTADKNEPVMHAVIIANPAIPVHTPEQVRPNAVIDQIDKEFVPLVSVVRTGTAIQFPNSDNIRHHVYSFSPAKSFELPLYIGMPAEPVIFDKAGIVTLGCNIHDWMIAYVYVVDSPYTAITDKDGSANITNMPAGDYEVSVLHYEMDQDAKAENIHISVNDDDKLELQSSITLKPRIHPRRSPMRLNRGGY